MTNYMNLAAIAMRFLHDQKKDDVYGLILVAM
jgi:hypothetical protein